MKRLLVVLVAVSLVLLASVDAASSATSFCKCICFNNSTIIALNPPKSSSSSARTTLLDRASEAADSGSGSGSSGQQQQQQHLTCTSCNRAFCLSYKLPICANAREEDVFAQCFQRDSVKDEAVVFIFIFATAGLLGWALLRPWVVKWTGWGSAGRDEVGAGGGGGGREARYVPLAQPEGEGAGEGRDLGGGVRGS